MPAFALTGRIRQAALVYAAVGVVWILASDRLLAWLVTDPAWYAIGSTLKGWAFVGLTALLLWWLGARADTAPPRTPADAEAGRNARARPWMALAAVALLGAVAVADTVQRHLAQRDADLAQRAQASAARVDAWLGERLADARTYGSSKIYARLYEQWHDRPAVSETPLTQRLRELQALKGWLDVSLYDAAGQLLWRAQAANGVSAPELVTLAIQRREAVIGEPRVNRNDRLEIPMAVPLAQVDGAAPVLKIHLDAAAVLAGALVPSWGSMPGDNGALVVRSGDRWRAWAAPRTEDLSDPNPVEAPALAAGLPVAGLAPDADLHTPLEGSDSAGHAFLARAKPLANAPGWVLLATRDMGDDLQRLLRAAGPVALAAVLGLLLTAALLGRTQRDAALRTARHERERSGDRLRSAQLLQTVLDGAGIALVLTDTQGRVLLCSREAARLAGGDLPPTAGEIASDRLPPSMLHGTPGSGVHDGGVERWSTPVGDREFTVLRGTLRDDSGRAAAHYVLARDVSAQQENERALARSEQQLSMALQGAELGLWDWQVDTGTAHFSDRWCTMLGYRPEDVGSSADAWRALVHPDDEPDILAVLQPHLAGQTATYRCEHRLRHRDGHWVWVLAAGRVVERDASGAPLRAVGIHLDISDRRAALQALEDSRAALEQRVEERTAALAEATQRAEAASVAKSAFLANMSHEIRTPLNAVLGLTRLLIGQVADPGQQDRLQKIERAARHLATLIDDILDLSKIEAGRLTLEHIAFDPEEVLEQVRTLLAPQAESKGLALRVHARKLPPRVGGDPTRLRQALLNLAGNAVKFTAQGQVTFRASIQTQDETHCTLRFEVEDTGIGIAPDVAERLFRPFVQTDGSTTRRFGGTGLGLAITRHLANAMEGDVGVRSRPGQGACFWFTCRVALDPAHDGLVSGNMGLPTFPGAESLQRRHGGARVLLAEDEPVNREIACALLEEAGLQITTVTDGQAAVDAVLGAPQDRPFELLLMDLHMPRMDGLAATARLREAGVTTPVVALTASAFDVDRQHCRQVGMDGFVPKPFNAEQLFQAVTAALSLRPRRQPSPMPTETTAATARPAMAVATVIDPAELALLRRLRRKLNVGGVAARELAVANAAQLVQALGADGQQLVDSVREFEMERALEIVERVLAQHSATADAVGTAGTDA